nr:MAG TPA: hypothetical protein [Caudoviricetes sp.]
MLWFLIKRRDLLASPFFVIHQNLNSSQILPQKHLWIHIVLLNQNL